MVTSSSSYVSSKIGMTKFVEVLAAENPDVRFHTIHPGVVETDMAAKSEMGGLPRDTVELPSHYAVWIASPEAVFLKGKFSWCNWDVDELKAKAKSIEESAIFTTNIEGWPFSP
jgi:NAD(P)-dependent dehydrogenase (short-subunit alcohol dehydrogenase family)